MKRGLYFILAVFFVALTVPCISSADDTAIYDIADDVKPNVLIIFDNSGSMSASVPYSDATTYDLIDAGNNKYLTDTIYERECSHYWWDRRRNRWVCDSWSWVASSMTLATFEAGDSDDDGIYDSDSDIRKGNRLNYDFGSAQDRITLARQAVKDVIDLTYDYARFGIMVLNGAEDINVTWDFPDYHNDTTVLAANQGAAEIADRGEEDIEDLMDQLDSLDASGGTPLANRLINAAKYFRGTFGSYTRPLDESNWCRKNFVIIMTDGKPEGEGNGLSSNNNGDYDFIETFLDDNPGTRDTDSDSHDPDPSNEYSNGGSDYLDDLAYYLHHTEDSLDPDDDAVTDITGNQNLTIYTIGFTIDDDLLQDTADNGGGKYYTANDADELAEALLGTMISIIAQTQTFTAPVVPVQRTTSGTDMYISLFTPKSSQNFWPGYLIKANIGEDGEIMGFATGYGTGDDMALTVDDYELHDNVVNPTEAPYPYWDAQDMLRNRSTNRNIYTYLGTSTNLTDTSNAFNTSTITAALLDNPSKHENAQTGPDAHVDLINFLIGLDSYDDDTDGVYDEKRDTILGDILHSRPLIIDYSSSQRVIYVGTNEGMLHAFDDSDGSEKWAFIPPDLLPELKNIAESVGHQYFVDGSPQGYTLDGNNDGDFLDVGTDKVIIIFGERRGGNSYCALDVTNPDAPQYLWRIDNANPTVAGIPNPTTVISELGQSWSEPQIGEVRVDDGMGGTEDRTVAIIGGGYSPDDSAGRALYIINALTGALEKSFTVSDHANMTYSIPSAPLAVDTTFDGYINRLYVGDLGGQMWRFGFQRADDTDTGVENGNVDNWTPRLLFGTNTGSPIFYSPDLVLEPGYAYVYFGTGDRTSPCTTTDTNRLFAVKDRNEDDVAFAARVGAEGKLIEDDLVDLTENLIQDGTAEEAETTLTNLENNDGWYITMEGTGEKILAAPVVIFGWVFFSTFLPDTDPCSYGGDAYLYAVDYLSGVSVLNFDEDGDLDKADRSLNIGHGIPTEAVVTINAEGETVVYVGAGGGIFRLVLPDVNANFTIDSWRELF